MDKTTTMNSTTKTKAQQLDTPPTTTSNESSCNVVGDQRLTGCDIKRKQHAVSGLHTHGDSKEVLPTILWLAALVWLRYHIQNDMPRMSTESSCPRVLHVNLAATKL
jgi:hypothetical protein